MSGNDDETTDKIDEISEINALLLPGSDFWKWDQAKQDKMLAQMKSRSEHPAVVAMQRQLASILLRAARQLPEVLTLVACAQKVGDLLTYDPGTPLGVALDRLRAAAKALDEKD